MPSLEILFEGRVYKNNWEQYNWDLGIFWRDGTVERSERIVFMVEDGQFMCKSRTMPRDGSSAQDLSTLRMGV